MVDVVSAGELGACTEAGAEERTEEGVGVEGGDVGDEEGPELPG